MKLPQLLFLIFLTLADYATPFVSLPTSTCYRFPQLATNRVPIRTTSKQILPKQKRRRRLLSRPGNLLRTMLLLPVNLLALFVAAVLSRAINQPSVRSALGACIVSGVQQLCEDPNLDDYIDRATKTINEDLEDDARELAGALPKVMRGFFQGLVAGSDTDSKQDGTTHEASDKA